MADLTVDISFGTGRSVQYIEKALAKNTAGSLYLLGADLYDEDGRALTPEEQRAQLVAMFEGVADADPSTLVLRSRTRALAPAFE